MVGQLFSHRRFTNWQKAKEKFKEHEKTKLHSGALQKLCALKTTPINDFHLMLPAKARTQRDMSWRRSSSQTSSLSNAAQHSTWPFLHHHYVDSSCYRVFAVAKVISTMESFIDTWLFAFHYVCK